MSAQTRSQVLALLERFGLVPRKALGQHFLADPNITRRIVATAGIGPGDQVVEIGAGTGTLTVTLAEAGASRVVAYEIDQRLRPLLEEVVGPFPAVELRFEDAGGIPGWTEPGSWSMVANLPYNVGTPILLDVLRRTESIRSMVVMVQREVAERLVAPPGSPAYGIPSIVVALHAAARLRFWVPPQVFVPAPRVGSAVVRLDRRPAPEGSERALQLAAAAFGQRRKMLRGSLARVVSDPAGALERAGISPMSRAEEVPPEAWLRLAEVTGA